MLADSQAELYAGLSMMRDCAQRYDAKPAARATRGQHAGLVHQDVLYRNGGPHCRPCRADPRWRRYIAEYKAERFYRDVRLLRLYEGTTQIQQIIIAKQLLRD